MKRLPAFTTGRLVREGGAWRPCLSGGREQGGVVATLPTGGAGGPSRTQWPSSLERGKAAWRGNQWGTADSALDRLRPVATMSSSFNLPTEIIRKPPWQSLQPF